MAERNKGDFLAISNERKRLAEYLAREDSGVVADYLSKTPKLQNDLLSFYPELDISALLNVLHGGKPDHADAARDYLDRYLEIRAGSIPAGRLPGKVRWRATRDDAYESAAKAKQSFEKAFQAVSRGSVAKAAFGMASLMYHASSASLSFMNLTKREKAIGTIVGANMAALTALWPGGDAPVQQDDIGSIIQSSAQQTVEKSVAVPSAPVQVADEYLLPINDSVSLTFADRDSYDRAMYLMESSEFKTYMGAPVSDEIRAAFVVGDALTPYPYEFWQGQAFAESTFNEKALNAATLARGIMQMTPDTTLEILYDMKDDPRYGFIPETQLVTKTFDDKWVASYSVLDGIDKQAVVASVAYDPLKAVMVAAEFNSKYLSLLQDRYPDMEMTSVHAYALHWQGYNGSQKLFNADAKTPAATVYGEASDVVKHHETIFYEDAKNKTGPRSVEDMLSYLETNRGLGNITIPDIAEWVASPVSVSYKPVNAATLTEHYRQTLAPLVSLVPKARPDLSTREESRLNTTAMMMRPKPKPADL